MIGYLCPSIIGPCSIQTASSYLEQSFSATVILNSLYGIIAFPPKLYQ